MKRFPVRFVLVATAIAMAAVPLRAADLAKDSIMGPIRTQWETTKKLVVGIAEVIPEAKYDYRPTPEVRTFREILIHLISENYLHIGFVTGENIDRSKFETLKTRDDILKALRESYDHNAAVYASMTDEKAAEIVDIRNQKVPRWMGALLNIADNMDHYGNLVVYVRVNGIVPPRTAGRALPAVGR
jgi:uncharacterized damage-inducible protein DinB